MLFYCPPHPRSGAAASAGRSGVDGDCEGGTPAGFCAHQSLRYQVPTVVGAAERAKRLCLICQGGEEREADVIKR